MVITIIKLIHLLGFSGCLVASFLKSRILRAQSVEGRALGQLVALDKISRVSALLIFATGFAIVAWLAKPTDLYLGSVSFWIKICLFVTASAAVLTTKPPIREAAKIGQLNPTATIRTFLVFDFFAILVMAGLGRWIATTLT